MYAAGAWLENKINMHTDSIKNQLNYLADKNDQQTCTQMNWILLYKLRKFPSVYNWMCLCSSLASLH